MRAVTITERVSAEIRGHAGRTRQEVACGLLLGWRGGEEFRIDRSLPCLNVADAAVRRTRFAIDPGALLNVRRSLEGRTPSIIGVYYVAAGGSGEPTALDREHLRLWPETVWLITTSRADGSARAWWTAGDGGEVRELSLRPAAARLAAAGCPE